MSSDRTALIIAMTTMIPRLARMTSVTGFRRIPPPSPMVQGRRVLGPSRVLHDGFLREFVARKSFHDPPSPHDADRVAKFKISSSSEDTRMTPMPFLARSSMMA